MGDSRTGLYFETYPGEKEIDDTRDQGYNQNEKFFKAGRNGIQRNWPSLNGGTIILW